MRKNINKLATLVMTGALAASMSFSAFATTGAEDTNKTLTTKVQVDGQIYKMPVSKKILTDGSVYAPNASFCFDVTPVTVEDGVTNTFAVENASETASYNIKSGIDGAVHTTAATFNPAELNLANDYASNFEIWVNAGLFTENGVYKYKLKESNGYYKVEDDDDHITGKKITKISNNNYPGMEYDDNTYYLYVFVTTDDNDKKVVNNIVIEKETFVSEEEGTGKKIYDYTKVYGLVNEYGNEEKPESDDMHDLTIVKELTGNMKGDSDQFKVSLGILSDAVNGEDFHIVKTVYNADGTVKEEEVNVTDTDGNTVRLNGHAALADDATEAQRAAAIAEMNRIELDIDQYTEYKITGLTADDEVFFKELGAYNQGYQAYYAMNGNNDTLIGRNTEKDDESNELSVSVSQDDSVLHIINERNQMIPTGVAMDIAPYALMVALAGGAAATFLRKKESFED